MMKSRLAVGRLVVLAGIMGVVGLAWGDADLVNLAVKKTATASSSEDANPPQNAVDGDMDTRWCSSDGSADCWWQVDLEKPVVLGGCEINWEHGDVVYKYVVEGSADGKTWVVLNDQRGSTSTSQQQKLAFAGDPKEVRYVRIKFTALEDGSWASFFEVKVFDAESLKKLTPEQLKAYLPSAPITAAAATQK